MIKKVINLFYEAHLGPNTPACPHSKKERRLVYILIAAELATVVTVATVMWGIFKIMGY